MSVTPCGVTYCGFRFVPHHPKNQNWKTRKRENAKRENERKTHLSRRTLLTAPGCTSGCWSAGLFLGPPPPLPSCTGDRKMLRIDRDSKALDHPSSRRSPHNRLIAIGPASQPCSAGWNTQKQESGELGSQSMHATSPVQQP